MLVHNNLCFDDLRRHSPTQQLAVLDLVLTWVVMPPTTTACQACPHGRTAVWELGVITVCCRYIRSVL